MFSRNSGTGALTLVEIHEDNSSPEAGGSPTVQTHLDAVASVAVSPGGSHVYVTSTDDDAITVFGASPVVPVEIQSFSIE